MTWREELVANLKAVRLAFLPGAEPTELQEAIDTILLAVSDFRKQAFLDGYKAGASDAALDADLEFNADLSKVGAEKRYLESLSEF